MKCPKCGSEAIYFMMYDGYFDTYQKYSCEKCDYELTEKECADYEYQQRLDKVLSKFSTISRGKLYSKNATAIFYNNEYETFSINDELNIISLETVESLLRDLSNE